jgi:2-deoxy-D-gluconate 3-dehydrogenase
MRLDGRVAVVTGCTRGIGRAVAVALARAGADIVGVSASLAPGSEVQAEVAALGRSFDAFACDFADRAAVAALAQSLGRVDVLVNNAGSIHRSPAVEFPEAEWDRLLQVNLTAQFALAQAVAPQMLERGSGKIVFVASLLSFQGGVNVVGYAASKGGIAQVTKALANEWAPRGVNVNAVVPGYIATDNTAPLRADEVRNRQILERIPAGRWGAPADVAEAVRYLASPAADYVHGTLLTVDGGWMGR